MPSVQVNMPYRVEINAQGEVSISALDQERFVFTDTATTTFNGFLRDAVLDAFEVTPNTDSYDPNIAVTMLSDKRLTFAADLAKQLSRSPNQAFSALSSETINNLAMHLESLALAHIESVVGGTDIAPVLKAGGVNGLKLSGLTTTYLNGGKDMFDGLKALAPHQRTVIALQINNAKWNAAWDVNSLPLKDGGDSMTFQFKISQKYSASSSSIFVSGDVADPAAGDIQKVVTDGVSLGSYDVSPEIINFVLTRAAPSRYNEVKDEEIPEPDQAPVDTAIFDLSAALVAYATAATNYSNALAAYNLADASHNAYVRADENVDTLTGLRDAKEETWGNVKAAYDGANAEGYTQADVAKAYAAYQTSISDLSGGIVARAAALALDPGLGNLEVLSGQVEIKSGLQSDALTAVSTKRSDLESANKQYAREVALKEYLEEELDAAQESANDARDHQYNVWSDASENAVEALGALETARSTLNSKDTALIAAEAALEADPADPTSGLKNDVDLAQGERNDASGNFDVKFAAAAAAVIVVNGKGKMSVPVGPYKAAYVLADENPEQLALVVQFDAPEAYEYAPPS